MCKNLNNSVEWANNQQKDEHLSRSTSQVSKKREATTIQPIGSLNADLQRQLVYIEIGKPVELNFSISEPLSTDFNQVSQHRCWRN